MMTFKLLSLLTVLSVLPFVQAIELQSGLALSFYACSNNSYVTGVTSNDPDGFTCSEGGHPVEVPLTDVILTNVVLSCNGDNSLFSDPIVVGFLTATSDNTDPPQLNSSTYFYSDQQGALSSYSHVPICTSAAYLNLVLSNTTFNSSNFDCSSFAWTAIDSSTGQVTCANVTQSATEQTFSIYACSNNSYVTNVTRNDANGFTCSSGASPVEVPVDGLAHAIIDANFYDSVADAIVIGILTDTTINQNQTQVDSNSYYNSHTLIYASSKFLNLAVSDNDWQTANISDGCSSLAWVGFSSPNNIVYCAPITQIPTVSSALLVDYDHLTDNLQYLECPYGFFNSLNGSSTQCQWSSDAMPVNGDFFIDAENVIDAQDATSTFSCGTNQAALRILGSSKQDADYFTNLFNNGGSTLLCANVQLDSDFSLVESENTAMSNSTINFNCTNVGNYTSTGFLKSITQQLVGSETNYFYTCLYLVPAANNSSVNSDGSGNTTDCSNPLTLNGYGKYLYGNSNQYKQGAQQNQGNYGNYGHDNQLSKLSVSGIANLFSDAANVNANLFAVLSTIFSLVIVLH